MGDDVILGHGDLRYAANMSWAKVDPAVAPVINAHAMAEGKDGNIYLVTDHPQNDFIVLTKTGDYVRSISAGLGGGHGLEIFQADGVEYLVHVDCGWHFAAEGWNPKPGQGKITLLKTDGTVVRTFQTPDELGVVKGKFMPCDVAFTPRKTLLVADGYASDHIYEYDLEGKILKHWGGHTKDAGALSNAHGVSIDLQDARGPVVWVPSRSENKLQAFTLDGQHLETLELPGAFAGQLFFAGELAYTAVCWSKDQTTGKRGDESGFVLVLDRKTKKVLSALGGSEPKFEGEKLQPLHQVEKVFKHGHDLYVDAAGDIYVGEWNAQRRYPAKLSLVKR
jgi:DNA-binding beta-propeller fold protein YncE